MIVASMPGTSIHGNTNVGSFYQLKNIIIYIEVLFNKESNGI